MEFEPDTVFDLLIAGGLRDSNPIVFDGKPFHYGFEPLGGFVYVVAEIKSAFALLRANFSRNFYREIFRKAAADKRNTSGTEDPINFRKSFI